jgi:dolichyl-phosphate-mannose--protein O-mannosyl transferase
MVLAGVYAVRDIATVPTYAGHRSAFRVGVASFLIVTSVAMFVFFLPVLTGRTVSYDQWKARMWYGKCLPKATWCWI